MEFNVIALALFQASNEVESDMIALSVDVHTEVILLTLL
jgi:hypothetical protein